MTLTWAFYPSWLPAGWQVDSGFVAAGLGCGVPGCVQPAGPSWPAPAADYKEGAEPEALC